MKTINHLHCSLGHGSTLPRRVPSPFKCIIIIKLRFNVLPFITDPLLNLTLCSQFSFESFNIHSLHWLLPSDLDTTQCHSASYPVIDLLLHSSSWFRKLITVLCYNHHISATINSFNLYTKSLILNPCHMVYDVYGKWFIVVHRDSTILLSEFYQEYKYNSQKMQSFFLAILSLDNFQFTACPCSLTDTSLCSSNCRWTLSMFFSATFIFSFPCQFLCHFFYHQW